MNPFSIALAGSLLAAALPASAQAPVSPRLAQAQEAAATELREALARVEAAGSTATARSAAELAAGRARAWAAALGEASAAAHPQDSDALVTAVRGDVHLLRGGQALAPRRGMLLREADELSTEAGRLELRFHDGSSIALGPGTRLRVLQAPRGSPPQASFVLQRGTFSWESRASLAGSTRLMTERSMAHLKGGRATVRATADGGAALEVQEGGVELVARPGGQSAPPAWEDVYK